ncbi:MAG TPA: DHA2 family efflux MFS transporter permease subunit [Planctomycetota bacterium]|nr:DHA2 family efflux MFS transporter permease subunit [Planctomycetota bacterium]
MSSAVALPKVQLEQGAAEWRPRHNPWLIAITVTLATFMEVLDTSVANVALPHIAGNLAASQDEATWVLTSYLVSNAIILPISAWLATYFGRKRFYMFSVAVFTVSSALCGLAPSLGVLVLFRVIQGFGGGGLQPVEQAILADTFEPKKRGMAFAVYGIAVVCAPTLGPTLGGWITDNWSWRWIFYVNIPVGILSLVLTHFMVEDPPHIARAKSQIGRVDAIGLGLIALGLGALQVVLDKGQREDWLESKFIVIFTVLTVVGLVGATVWELREKDPIVDLRALRERNFGASTVLMFFLGFGLYGTTTLLPMFLQEFLGYTATQAGMALSFGALATLAAMPVVGKLLEHGVQPKLLVMFGLGLSAVSLWRMMHWSLDVDFWRAASDRVFQAIGIAFTFVPLNTGAYAFLSKEKTGNASGLMNLARNIGGSVGIAVATTILDRRAQVHQAMLVGHMTPFDHAYQIAVTSLTHAMHSVTASTFEATNGALAVLTRELGAQASMLASIDAFEILAVMFLVGIPLTFVLRRVKVEKGAMAVH